ncbi:MAG: succinylglutamate desuccinylase/aspartoacylase family protein [Acidimicrobiia bacterium]
MPPKPEAKPALICGGQETAPGRKSRYEVPVSRLPTGSRLSMPVVVINGKHPGPTVWLSGAIHGDELNGVEVVRRVLPYIDQRTLRGAIIAVPVVNVFGFVEQSRYLPDGRDLNRSFPGSVRGSMASQLAALFMKEVVMQCELGIDLHTAAAHRTNVPQVRANLDDAATLELANAFGAPFVIDARLRDGSLRAAATKRGIKVLLYEAGQIHRFDEHAIRDGVNGVLRVLQAMGMGNWDTPSFEPPIDIRTTRWVRARRAGLMQLETELGAKVEKGDVLGLISDALGNRSTRVTAPSPGHVIALNQNPLITQGEALVHIAS